MLRNSSALSRMSFEAPQDEWERRRGARSSPDLSRSGSGVSQPISEEEEEWETWREEHPCALQHFDVLAAAAAGKLVAVFLDYDGTLTPIVSNPDAAFMPEQARDAVRRVAELFPTAIVSGRGREKVEAFVQLRQLFYAGSHGMDIVGPRPPPGSSSSSSGRSSAASAHGGAGAGASGLADGGGAPCEGGACGGADDGDGEAKEPEEEEEEVEVEEAADAGKFTFQAAAQFEPLVNAVYRQLEGAVARFPGASVEHNKFCVSVHFRNCAPEDYPGVLAATEGVAGAHAQLHITRGRKVLEVRPQVDWDKGAALAHLLESMGLADPARVYALYIGDDRTDEDAFRVLAERGLGAGILVSTRVKPTAGRWTLREPAEVAAFLNRLVVWGQSDANQWHEVRSCAGWSIATPQGSCCTLQHQPGQSPQWAAAAQAQQVLAAMDGLCLQQQQQQQQRPGRGGGGAAAAGGPCSAAALLQRPPLPPKPRRGSSLSPEGELQPRGQQDGEEADALAQQRAALRAHVEPNGTAAAPAACGGAQV
eukprot:scaffold2.g6904.t1